MSSEHNSTVGEFLRQSWESSIDFFESGMLPPRYILCPPQEFCISPVQSFLKLTGKCPTFCTIKQYRFYKGKKNLDFQFNHDLQDLVSLSTGKVATPEVETDLLRAQDIGQEAFRAFQAQRLESDPPQVKFNDKLTKAKLKTFSDLNKRIVAKTGKNKEVILKADRKLFAQMIVIAESRNLKMKEVLSHALGPLPWPLATPDGLLRKTKASLTNELLKNAKQ
ncbi:hypothetical protein Bbelb_257330 [Branchiostoma belcheri]|nr:hypothetical protein Bbelb_257330 [Branchiostoma belcheri]